jgi:cysteine synthase A
MKANTDILKLIGNTPLVRINRMTEPGDAEIWGKLEGYNPGGSVADERKYRNRPGDGSCYKRLQTHSDNA